MWRIALFVGVGLALAGAAAVVLGLSRWSASTARSLRRLDEARRPGARGRFEPDSLAGLPEPVRRCLAATLAPGTPIVTAARFRHRGTFCTEGGAARWWPFTSEQHVVTVRPGFHWDARMSPAPGMRVHVRDAYVAGEGILQAALLGLVPLADQRGGRDLAQGELMRFLAESAWYPTLLLPGEGVRWEAVDDHTALATLADGEASATLRFRFGDSGLIESVEADARPRTMDGKVVPTRWRGRFWNHAERDGIRVPLDGEVAWILPEGERPYWRGHITDIAFESD